MFYSKINKGDKNDLVIKKVDKVLSTITASFS